MFPQKYSKPVRSKETCFKEVHAVSEFMDMKFFLKPHVQGITLMRWIKKFHEYKVAGSKYYHPFKVTIKQIESGTQTENRKVD
jgi:hypothetical protein